MSKNIKDALGTRIKKYEHITRDHLIPRMPVIMRLDGKAFHTFLKNAEKPFDSKVHTAMTNTAYELVKHIQGAVLAYTQSDEISILIKDWHNVKTESWFDNNIQKMVSVSSSIATATFNKDYTHINGKVALFDSRVFNLPEHEVVNYFIWRQQDATRNSIQMLGQHYFSHKKMQGKNQSQIQDMLMELEAPINWNELSTWKKRGSCIKTSSSLKESGKMKRHVDIDHSIPMFTADKNYINCYL